MNTHAISVSDSLNRIAALDLEALKFKLSVEDPEKWTTDRLDTAENAYKRFLMLVARFPEERLVPSGDVDDFWHQHILDTGLYARDCEYVLGYFLHHWPYSGLMGREDERAQRANVERTRNLYLREFGETYVFDGKCSSCSRACDGGGHATAEGDRPRPRLERVAA